MNSHDILDLAEDAIKTAVDSPGVAQAVAKNLQHLNLFEEVVAGMGDVTVRFDPFQVSRETAANALLTTLKSVHELNIDTLPVITISVHYGNADGPDFDQICNDTGLSANALIEHHSAPVYIVDMVGFMPGFAYLSGLNSSLSVPRLQAPRPRVPAGSIGISGLNVGVYPLPSPGGWQLIGRTNHVLFAPQKASPFLLTPGRRVRFEPA